MGSTTRKLALVAALIGGTVAENRTTLRELPVGTRGRWEYRDGAFVFYNKRALVLRLRAPTGSRLQFGCLLVHLRMETRSGGLGAMAAPRAARRRGGLEPTSLGARDSAVSVPAERRNSVSGFI